MAAFNSVFNKCFKEELSQYGFRKLKGLDAVGRVVGKELMQYIILYPRSSLVRGRKTFTAVFGICTVYSFSSADIWKYDLINRGVRLIEVAPKREPEKESCYKDPAELQWLLYEYLYDPKDQDSMATAAAECAGCIKQYALPVLDGITDIRAYVGFCKEHTSHLLRFADTMPDNDALLLILTDDHDDMMQIFEKNCKAILEQSYQGDSSSSDYKRNEELLYDAFIVQTAKARDKIYDDPELYKKAFETLGSRKLIGQAVFKKLGVNS